MQCPSTVRSYVFRSIFLPYYSTSTSTSSSSIRQCQYTTTTAAAVKLTSESFRSSSSSPSLQYLRQPLDTRNPRKSISSLQQVRGHDPPNIDRQTISQRRTREYLGFRDESGKSDQRLSGHSRTNVTALEKILQSYRSEGREDKEQGDINRKGKQELQENSSDNASVTSHQQAKDTSSLNLTELDSSANTFVSPTPSSTSTELASSQISTTKPLSSSTSSIHSDPTFPPIIYRLLSARLFRLAVFHALSTPEYATNTPLLLSIADHLESKGAGTLARRLRRGWENSLDQSSSSSSSSSPEKKIRLFSDPKSKFEGRLPPNHWQIPLIPPSNPNANITKQRTLTEYYNAHLEFQLKKSSLSSSQYSASPSSPIMNDWPHPSSNLNQLRKLLSSIEKMEKHRGFIPDRKTGNLIIGCWLRCVTHPHPHSRRDEEMREYKDREGIIRVVRKQHSEKGRLGVKELRGLFGVLSRIIVSTRAMTVGGEMGTTSEDRSLKLEGIGHRQTEVDDTAISLAGTGTSKKLDDQNQKEYQEIVRPFGKNMIRSMKSLGDGKGVDMVREWMREQKEALLKDGD
ncbi:hypothetical protein I302_107248 [Kwoniella bestiolae CBS 10118]|uniref:Uncharacterized protein n=1 Tax=Kwoniella bestiolae CBS 10118 TaxID=1296100 RepID=A0A1B9FZ48_9TREE|nr:hypothetical protein I302_07017 [Kwoniella bestiolae CBS 10118]OCF24031.1 hypothetical protein I302_07017 [Kwoniella bestiolae CBS 10118]